MTTEIKVYEDGNYSNEISIDQLSYFDQNERVTNIHIVTLDSSITSLDGVFKGCKQLERVTHSSGALSNITSMVESFMDCIKLRSVILSDIASLTTLDRCFQGCSSLVVFNEGGNAIPSAASMEDTWKDCTALSAFGDMALPLSTTVETSWSNTPRLVDRSIVPPGPRSIKNRTHITESDYIQDRVHHVTLVERQRIGSIPSIVNQAALDYAEGVTARATLQNSVDVNTTLTNNAVAEVQLLTTKVGDINSTQDIDGLRITSNTDVNQTTQESVTATNIRIDDVERDQSAQDSEIADLKTVVDTIPPEATLALIDVHESTIASHTAQLLTTPTGGSIAALGTRVDGVETANTLINTQIQLIKDKNILQDTKDAALTSDIATLNAKITPLTGEVYVKIEAEKQAVLAEVLPKIHDVETLADNVQAEFRAIQNSTSVLESQMDGHNYRIQQNTDNINDLQRKHVTTQALISENKRFASEELYKTALHISANTSEINTLYSQLTATNDTINTVANGISDNETLITALNLKIDQVESDQQTFAGQFISINAEINNLMTYTQGEIRRLNRRLDTLIADSGIDKFQDMLDAFILTSANHTDRIEELELTVTTMDALTLLIQANLVTLTTQFDTHHHDLQYVKLQPDKDIVDVVDGKLAANLVGVAGAQGVVGYDSTFKTLSVDNEPLVKRSDIFSAVNGMVEFTVGYDAQNDTNYNVTDLNDFLEARTVNQFVGLSNIKIILKKQKDTDDILFNSPIRLINNNVTYSIVMEQTDANIKFTGILPTNGALITFSGVDGSFNINGTPAGTKAVLFSGFRHLVALEYNAGLRVDYFYETITRDNADGKFETLESLFLVNYATLVLGQTKVLYSVLENPPNGQTVAPTAEGGVFKHVVQSHNCKIIWDIDNFDQYLPTINTVVSPVVIFKSSGTEMACSKLVMQTWYERNNVIVDYLTNFIGLSNGIITGAGDTTPHPKSLAVREYVDTLYSDWASAPDTVGYIKNKPAVITASERAKLAAIDGQMRGVFSNESALNTHVFNPVPIQGHYVIVGSFIYKWNITTTTWVNTNSTTVTFGDMERYTYDPQNKLSDAFDMVNMEESADNKIFTLAERAKLQKCKQSIIGYAPPTPTDGIVGDIFYVLK